jgi:hypothetical protein
LRSFGLIVALLIGCAAGAAVASHAADNTLRVDTIAIKADGSTTVRLMRHVQLGVSTQRTGGAILKLSSKGAISDQRGRPIGKPDEGLLKDSKAIIARWEALAHGAEGRGEIAK